LRGFRRIGLLRLFTWQGDLRGAATMSPIPVRPDIARNNDDPQFKMAWCAFAFRGRKIES